jgi:hypothetical protein
VSYTIPNPGYGVWAPITVRVRVGDDVDVLIKPGTGDLNSIEGEPS